MGTEKETNGKEEKSHKHTHPYMYDLSHVKNLKKQKQQQQQKTGILVCLNDKAIKGDLRPLLLLSIEG